MDIKLRCPHCFLKISASDEHKGTKVDCPSCSKRIKIPSPKCGTGLDVGGFVIEQWLGNGAMGEVHLAKQTAMDRMVALKILPDECVEEDEDQTRFFQEVKTLAKLNHPNIVSAISAGEFDGGAYLAMNFINGVTIEDKINSEGSIGEKEAIRCALAIAEALDYAWKNNGLIHRDLKPANFMIDENEAIHLMDLGLAKTMDNDLNLTVDGIVMGTPYYMSPEQARGDKVLDQRSDIYSLGASLYHMVTGLPPYDGHSSLMVMTKKLSEPPIAAKVLKPNLSVKICHIIDSLMQLDKEDRMQEWPEVIQLLKTNNSQAQKKIHVSTDKSKNASQKGFAKKTSSKVFLILLLIVLVSSIVLAVSLLK
ncbi:MAG: serine/threonine protein kinase [Lentisphaeraceae bacterium]|nr:serine/threonine protein kinase [Lentisphaeraceae bacterium]